MKVLLTQFVKKVGNAGEIVEVADGFAVNSLFPQKKAIQVTAKILNDHKTKVESDIARQEKNKKQVVENILKLENKKIVIKEKLNSKNSLYHAIGPKEIIRAIHDQHNISVTNEIFNEKLSLKDAGKHEIEISSHGKNGTLSVEIVSS